MEYYETVLLGKHKKRQLICNICEEDKKTFTAEDSEIQMIKHIQTDHKDKNLVIEVTGKRIRLVPNKEAGQEDEGIQTRSAKKRKLFQTTVSYEDGTQTQARVRIDQVFFPCDECSGIFLSKAMKMKHMLTHD